MKNRFIIPIFFTLIITVLTCGVSNIAFAQTTEDNQAPLEIKDSFLGHWVEIQNPNHILEIYKEGSLIIVQKRTEVNDGSGSNKYSVIHAKGNRLTVDLGNGSTPLTITDDGNKISFLGNEYMKK